MTFRQAFERFMLGYKTVEPESIPFIIWLMENPMSPLCLHGSASLRDHDAVHVLLECDQSNDSEAFVIGFTMGTDDRIKSWEVKIFKFISRYFYPAENKFTKRQIQIFQSGFRYGQSRKVKRIGEWAWHKEDWDISLKEMQEKFGVMSNELAYYKGGPVANIISPS